MQSFTDANGKRWTFTVDSFHLMKVKKATGIDLANSIEDPAALEKIFDPIVFFEIVVVLLESQMSEAGVSQEDLGQGLNDETKVLEATRALINGILDFFREDRRVVLRQAFERMWKAIDRKLEAEIQRAGKALSEADIEAIVDRGFETFGKSSSSLPGTSG